MLARLTDAILRAALKANGNRLFLVGRLASSPLGPWELLGIYVSRGRAVERCRHSRDFVWPCRIEEDFPENATEMPGAFFPWVKAFDPADIARAFDEDVEPWNL